MFGFFKRRKAVVPVPKRYGSSAYVPSITPTPPRDDSSDFIIGYATGFPLPSASGVMGAMLHQSSNDIGRTADYTPSRSEPDSTPSSSSDSTPSYTAPSSDSSPSYSSDSGSSYSAPSDPGGM